MRFQYPCQSVNTQFIVVTTKYRLTLNKKIIYKLLIFVFYRFIAERGDGGQLLHVDKIDEFFKLKPMPIFQDASRPARTTPVERPLQIPSNTPW
jgi:hypothetical protein